MKDRDSMKLIRLKHHNLTISNFYYHCDMVEFTVSKKSLNLCSNMISIEEKNISSLSRLKKLFFSQHFFIFIGKFLYRL